MRYDHAFQGDEFHSALLTTYSFDPTVFENVPLVAMRSRGCRNIAILVDRDMVNRALSELAPAPRAGTAYHLAKRKVARAFHPKIVLQLGKAAGQLMVGSANLTGAGLVGNLEAISTISVTEEDQTAAPLLAAALAYFERHADSSDPAMKDGLSRARNMTPWLNGVPEATEVEIDRQRVALLTEAEDRGIGESFASFIGNDTVHQLVVVSPYADENLQGFARLRTSLGMPPTALVADPFEQDFTADTFRTQADATLHSSAHHDGGNDRHLHAKLIIARGRDADHVLVGSANASMPGLFSRFGGAGNAEACIARTEPAGTALERLGLTVCLSSEMAPNDMKQRLRHVTGAERSRVTPADGGAFWIEHRLLFWRPPVGVDPSACLLRLQDVYGDEVVASAQGHEHGSWSADIEPDANAPRQAIVIFEDGSESAPVPVASLGRLRTNSRPPQKGMAARILADLEDRDQIDAEDYDRAMKLLALARLDVTKKRDTTRKRKDDTPEDEGETLTEEVFGRIEQTAEGLEALKSGPISEMRRLVNSFLGLHHDAGADEDELDPLSRQVKGANKGKNGDQENGNHGNGDKPDGVSRPSEIPSRSEHSAANDRADKLVWHVVRTCQALSSQDVDPLGLESSIRLHLLINVFLKSCAPVGEKPTPDHPISSTAPARSWIRVLGRLLTSLDQPIANQVERVRHGHLEEENVEALTSILFCAGLVLDAARAGGMPRPVVAQIEAANGRIATSFRKMLTGKPTAEAYVRNSLPSLAASHRLSIKNEAPVARGKATS